MSELLSAPPDREEINLLPVVKYSGPVQVVNDENGILQALEVLGAEGLLGFDIECRPSFVKGRSHPPALLQLAGADLVCLFPLRDPKILDALAPILADPGKIKAGVAVADDLKKLQILRTFRAESFVDLGSMAARAGLKAAGIRTLAAHLLGWRISKGERCSNWERARLTPRQVLYAATDAWISREIYLSLAELLQRKEIDG